MKLYKFSKPQCPPCNTIAAILKTIELPEGIELVEINVTEEENKHYLDDFGITSVPVLMAENGKRLNGATNKNKVVEFINGLGG
jgi:glutaredoxin